MQHTISENVFAGNAMNRRLFYQYGVLLPVNPYGYVTQGLGHGISRETSGLIRRQCVAGKRHATTNQLELIRIGMVALRVESCLPELPQTGQSQQVRRLVEIVIGRHSARNQYTPIVVNLDIVKPSGQRLRRGLRSLECFRKASSAV